MKKHLLLLSLLLTALVWSAHGRAMPSFAENGRNQAVWYVPQHGECKEITESDMRFLKKTLDRAGREKVALVIFELDTPGGRVDTALRYISIFAKSPVPVAAYLNPQGISAGMLIALAADAIAIHPTGVIGNALPMAMSGRSVRPVTEGEKKSNSIPASPRPEARKKDVKEESLRKLAEELLRQSGRDQDRLTPEEKRLADQKFLTVYFKVLEVLARKNNRPERVVRAMADPYCKLTEQQDGFRHDGNKPLTLSAAEAKKLRIVDHIASNREELLDQLGCPRAEVREIRRSGLEQTVDFLTLPAVAGILIALGLVGLYIEITTPGFGVPGILGVAALVLFFAGHAASGASDWEPTVIFGVGLLLIALEVFVIPGFGLVGVLGGGCVIWSFFGAFGSEGIGTAIRVVLSALSAAVIAITLLVIYVLPRSRLFASLTLGKSTSREEGFRAAEADESLIGASGVTLTPLRPAGTVFVRGQRCDAVSEGDFLERDTAVIVRGRNGFQLIVDQSKQTKESLNK